jgi:hypothetical protein
MDNKFDLQLVLDGKPIETVTGRPAEFIAYRPTAVAPSQVLVQVDADVLTYYADGTRPRVDMSFDLRMKSVVKQIDWSKLPVDTLIILGLYAGGDKRYFSSFTSGLVHCYRFGMTSKTMTNNSDIFPMNPSNVQIAPDQPWTVWLGGDCPIPDGLEFEYMSHNEPGVVIVSCESASAYLWKLKRIYAYRPTGKVLNGWKL